MAREILEDIFDLFQLQNNVGQRQSPSIYTP
jgi:hypothetical protein